MIKFRVLGPKTGPERRAGYRTNFPPTPGWSQSRHRFYLLWAWRQILLQVYFLQDCLCWCLFIVYPVFTLALEDWAILFWVDLTAHCSFLCCHYLHYKGAILRLFPFILYLPPGFTYQGGVASSIGLCSFPNYNVTPQWTQWLRGQPAQVLLDWQSDPGGTQSLHCLLWVWI